ncbi:MAG: sensor histidine kinase [Methylocystis sp.]|uniref:sensor histidine kinase n=1 Tax=Methylocystis sp. TaxID=1911079 RepID=UPI003DA6CE0C
MFKLSWPTFRRAAFAAAAYVSASVVTFALMHWKISSEELERFESLLELQGSALSMHFSGQTQPNLNDKSFNKSYRLTRSGLFESDGAHLEGNLLKIPGGLPFDGKAQLLNRASRSNGDESQMIYVGIRLPDQRILVIGRDTPEVVDLDKTVKGALIEGVIPISLVFIGIGAIVSRQIKTRLKDAQTCLDDIKSGHLKRRLPLSDANDELDSLSVSVNEMLEELERAIKELHHVGDNIAHDLRTPLCRVRSHLELAQNSVELPADLHDTINLAVGGVDQMLATTTAMLRAARIEAGRSRAYFRKVNLQEVLSELLDLYEPLAESKGLKLSLVAAAPAYVDGDKELLMEAVSNLIDNAIKFTPAPGLIDMTLCNRLGSPVISIRDSGPGIPYDRRANVFERFYRDPGRSNTPGTGLGLALVASIGRLHRFEILIRDASPGCIFELVFNKA